jgi:hypothetical protein
VYSYQIVRESLFSIFQGLQMPNIRPTLWQAFFDESGKLQDPKNEIVVFGGLAGPSNSAVVFEQKWEACIHHNHLSCTSMKDAIHFQGPYEAWKDNPTKRDDVLRQLAQLLADSDLFMVSSPMTSAEFKSLPQETRKKLWNDPQYCGFEACLMGVLAQRNDSVMHVACDLSEEYSEKCITLFNKLRKRNQIIKARCFAITFADDKRSSGLQAADMIAYCSRADHQRILGKLSPLLMK